MPFSVLFFFSRFACFVCNCCLLAFARLALCVHQLELYYAEKVDVNQYPAIMRCFADTFFFLSPSNLVPQAIPFCWLNSCSFYIHLVLFFISLHALLFAVVTSARNLNTIEITILRLYQNPSRNIITIVVIPISIITAQCSSSKRRNFYKHYYVFMNIGSKLNVKFCNNFSKMLGIPLTQAFFSRKSIPNIIYIWIPEFV